MQWYLHLETLHDHSPHDRKYSLKLISSHASIEIDSREWGFCRVSPIFPLIPGKEALPDLGDHCYVGLLFPTESVEAIFNEIAELDRKNWGGSAWFTHGLASVIVFAPDSKCMDLLKDSCQGELIALEVWTLEEGVVSHSDVTIYRDPPIQRSDGFTLSDYSELPEDMQFYLREVQHQIDHVVYHSQRWAPGLLPLFLSLVSWVNRAIQEVGHSERALSSDSAMHSAGLASESQQAMVSFKMKQYFFLDNLIQLSSMLSYVVTQGFSCRPPVLETSGCPIQSHSLFGVGAAVRGLFALSTKIERVFERFPIGPVLSKAASTLSGVQVFTDTNRYDPRVWRASDQASGKWFSSMRPFLEVPRTRSKLMAFSGRKSFRATEFGATVPAHCLWANDTARWSLMTVTHELLHAHVKDLIEAILHEQSNPDGYENSLREFLKYLAEGDQFPSDPGPPLPNLGISLRLIILNFCYCALWFDEFEMNNRRRRRNGKDALEKPSKRPSNLPTLEEMKEILRMGKPELSEIMTSVLDFNYFYACDTNLYLGFVWASWSKIPKVWHEIDVYLLRTLSVIATKFDGPCSKRFPKAVDTLMAALRAIEKRKGEEAIVSRALKLLEDQVFVLDLEHRFGPRVYIADATAIFLMSTELKAELGSDVDSQAGTIDENNETIVELPFHLVLEALKDVVSGKQKTEEVEYRSCRLLLRCAAFMHHDHGK
jgi:hypothetical protein